MRKLAATAIFLTLSSVSYGQTKIQLETPEHVTDYGLLPIDHVTDVLNRREDARRALESYHEGIRRGVLSASKTGEVYEIGETRQFLVHVNTLDGQSREKKLFELKDQSSVANIWVEVGELQNGHVDDEVLSELSNALLNETPEGSFNSNQGIIANNNQVFGDPPNVDNDPSPIVDILLYDIPDQNQGSVLAGFVWSGDMCTAANSGLRGCSVQFSNQADVLYLDTHPLLTGYPLETLLEVAAHEYQHLIHFKYDESEESFVNEGLSEWAERMNGYRARTISYLSSEAERNISLFSWRDGSEDVLKDYQRAGLFTTYLAERLGTLEMGAVTRQRTTGTSGYRAVLEGAGLVFEDLLLDFHTANLLNDRAVDSNEHFGYSNPNLQNLRASISPARIIDGITDTNTPPSNVVVNGGGSVYLRWERVKDFEVFLRLDMTGIINPSLQLARSGVRIVAEHADGGVHVEDLEVVMNGTSTTLPGDYKAVTLILAHVQPVSSAAIGVGVDKIMYEYSAAWGDGHRVESEVIRYDQGQVNAAFEFHMLASAGNGVVANKFPVPNPDAVLGRVYLSPYFMSQFSNGNQPEDAPRDFTLHVWGDNGHGQPGAELYSLPVIDTRDYPGVIPNEYELQFIQVDLSKERIPKLGEIVYIGYSEHGTDKNFIVLGIVDYTPENVSFEGRVSDQGIAWTRLWDRKVTSRDGEVEGTFAGRALPIRAEFLTGLVVDREEESELPSGVSLAQNYPNPFNPVTSIRYTLPAAGQVRLSVYDVTGRRVRSLVDQTMPSGEHTAYFDGSGFASGVYVYVLETNEARVSKKMLLLK